MAGDWIKMRADLHTHPKVVRISSALRADRLRTVGALHAVWCLFDAHSTDGTLEGYTPEAIDDLIGWPGFAAAMQAVEWLEVSEDFVSLPRFDEHNGKSAKRRAMETERKRRERVAETSGNVSASDADKKRTREEKRREEVCSSLRSEHTQGERSSPGPKPSKAAEMVWAMRQAGIADGNPSHPMLLALIEAGASAEEFRAAATKAAKGSKGFAYALAIVQRTREEAKDAASRMHTGPLPTSSTKAEKFNPTAYVNDPAYKAAWDEKKQGAEHGNVIDVEAQRVA